jgi:dipeptidyl aminopeptidase/acylaminoacyl peptidase
VVTAANDRTARIWDSGTGKLVRVLTGHRDALRSANYSPDGRYIVTASYDKTARIWDANDGVQLAVLPVQGDGVRSAAYSPNGDRIIAASLDTTATIWDARIPAGLDTQIKWMAAAQFDPLTTDERFQLGLPAISGVPDSGRVSDDEQLKAAKSADPARAVTLYEEAWAQGSQRAAFELGRFYEFGGPDRAHPVANVDLNKAWIWYQKGADAGEPFSMARLAQREELAAVAEQSASQKNTLLLSAFEYYAAASRRAELENWPDGNWRDWRFRRATLARLLARRGLMKEIADRYTKVVERWTSQPMTRFERFRRWLNI